MVALLDRFKYHRNHNNSCSCLAAIITLSLISPSSPIWTFPSCYWAIVVMDRSGRKNALTQPESSFCEVKYQFAPSPILHAQILPCPITVSTVTQSSRCPAASKWLFFLVKFLWPKNVPALSLCLFAFGQIIKTWTQAVVRADCFGKEKHIKNCP